MSKPRGFTIMEILIAIAVIAVLAAILFPAFAKAREEARRSECISNLRQLGVAISLYAEDFDDRYPWAYYPELIDRENASPGIKEVLTQYVRAETLWRCPSDIGETYWNGPVGWRHRTLPFYDPRKRVGATSYAYAGVGTSRFTLGELAGLQTGAVRRPSLAWLLGEFRPWHGPYRPDENLFESPGLFNVLLCDGHVAKKTSEQRDADETIAWTQRY